MTKKAAFTLIEVMVAVMIISVVVMALLHIYSNNTYIFTTLKKQAQTNQYTSFFISNNNYGFINEDVRLNDLLSEFDFNDDLRRKLKNIKVKLIYDVIKTIDDEETNEVLIKIGKTTIQTPDSSTALIRITK